MKKKKGKNIFIVKELLNKKHPYWDVKLIDGENYSMIFISNDSIEGIDDNIKNELIEILEETNIKRYIINISSKFTEIISPYGNAIFKATLFTLHDFVNKEKLKDLSKDFPGVEFNIDAKLTTKYLESKLIIDHLNINGGSIIYSISTLNNEELFSDDLGYELLCKSLSYEEVNKLRKMCNLPEYDEAEYLKYNIS